MNIDLSYLEDITGSDKDMMLEMLNLFIEDIPSQVEKIREAVEEKDMKSLGTESHKLKPTLQYVGLNEMYELVKKLEAIGKSGEYTNEVSNLTQELVNKTKISLPLLEAKAEEFK